MNTIASISVLTSMLVLSPAVCQDPAEPSPDKNQNAAKAMVWLETVMDTPVRLLPTEEARREAREEGEKPDRPEGSITEILISKDNKMRWAVISVGGLLGIGDKQVLVPYSDLHWAKVGDAFALGLSRTEADLKALPEFDIDEAVENGLCETIAKCCELDERLKTALDDDLKQQFDVAQKAVKVGHDDPDKAVVNASSRKWHPAPALLRASELSAAAYCDATHERKGFVQKFAVHPETRTLDFAVISLDDENDDLEMLLVPTSVFAAKLDEDKKLVLHVDVPAKILAECPRWTEAKEGQPILDPMAKKRSKAFFDRESGD